MYSIVDPVKVNVGVLVLVNVVLAVPLKPAVLLVCNLPAIVTIGVVPKVNNRVLALNIAPLLTVRFAAAPKVTLASAVTVPKVLLMRIELGFPKVNPVKPVL